MILLLFTAVLLVSTVHVEGQAKCTAANGSDGSCIKVTQCPHLLELINKDERTPAELRTLRRSNCGYEGTTPKVCCDTPATTPPPVSTTTSDPTSCFTPNGVTGRCINVYECPHLLELLSKKPVPQEAMVYAQNAKCNGPAQYSVCCSESAPVLNNKECLSTVTTQLPSTGCCGRESISDNKIMGGTATTVDQYPWLVLIEYLYNNRIKLMCGGVLISGRYVLTAGHCVAGAVLEFGTPKNIRLGEYDTAHDGEDCTPAAGGGEDCASEIVVIPIELIIPHPEYFPKNKLRRNDIALIKMSKLAPYTDFIRPICLPETDATLVPPEEFKLYAAGWGAINTTVHASNVKLHVDLPFKTLQDCQVAFNVPKRRVALWSKQMCAGGEKGKDSCKGDSGGPLMYENGRYFEVLGIVSFGTDPCGMEDVPGVYTKVYDYREWINSVISSN